MRNTFLLILFIIFINCKSNEDYFLNDFFVPEIPLLESKENISNNENNLKNYSFELFKHSYTINIDIDKEETSYLDDLPKTLQVEASKSDEDFNQEFYDMFFQDDYDIEVLENILNNLKERETGIQFDIVQVLVSFVQSIPYEEAAPQKYPLETLLLNKGDCSDKSVLLAKLLYLAGYDTCLFVYEEAKHMAVGLKIDDSSLAYIEDYIYIESTGYHPIGSIPTEFAGGVKIKEEPQVIKVGYDQGYFISGFNELRQLYKNLEDSYGEQYFNSNKEGKILLENITIERKKIDSMNIFLTDTAKKIEYLKTNVQTSFNKIDSINTLINDYNLNTVSLNDRINILNDQIERVNLLNRANYIKN